MLCIHVIFLCNMEFVKNIIYILQIGREVVTFKLKINVLEK